ncbi:MAG: methyl-accepting chemotaxis protein, partial [Sulfuricurvum sp.]|nr:methyl-accepting chemotaxis protein [Sulfuricurvum sp.]
MKWLDNMVLRSKLILLTAMMMFMMLVLGYMGFSATSQWEESVTELGEVRVPSLVSVGRIRNGVQMTAIQINRVRGLKEDPQMQVKMADASEQMKKAFERIDTGWKDYIALPQTDEEAIAWKAFVADYDEWRAGNEKFRTEVIDPLSKSNDPEQINALFTRMTEHIDRSSALRKSMQDNLQKVYDINKQIVADTSKVANESSSNFKTMFIIVVLVAFVLAIILATLIIRSITRAISQSVASIRDGAMQITSASDQVASSSSSLAQGASEQASSVEEVSATLEESTAINSQNVDNARQADILAKNANDSARAGYEKGEQLSRSMHNITESAAKISGIIKAIDQIAFQTNLLALNAAVEAARAGEHGLGFAVVADEVRNLAQRAASAAKETSDIIEEVVDQIKEGNQIALATHTSFQEIVEQSKKVSDL